MSDDTTDELEIRVLTASSADLGHALDAVARLRIEVFRAYPYLYEGDLDYERRYLASHASSPGAIVVVVETAAGRIVGASTGLPLVDEESAFRAPLVAAGYPSEDVYYLAESVLLPAFRGRGVYRRLFTERERQARATGHAWAAFCAVDRPDDHPRRPAAYRPLDAVWSRMGYARLDGVRATYAWREVGAEGETAKTLTFWVRGLIGGESA